jgi:peptidoglycan/LPS O-acetylase OafA/YrhL
MNAKRFEALDGWRGIAALAVAFYHIPIASPMRALAGWKNLELFVDLFFVLSGFVMMHAWGARLSGFNAARTFMIKRFWRIWPLHFVMLTVMLVLEIAKAGAGLVIALPLDGAPFTDNRSWATLISNIVLTQALNLHPGTSWNNPSWSISAEFWTYLAFAAATLAFRRPTTRALLGLSLAALALLVMLSKNFLFATYDFGFLRAAYGFFLGAVTYRLAMSENVQIGGGTGIEIAAVLAAASFLISTGLNVTSYLAPFVFAGVILVFAHGRGLVTRMLESRPIQALGLWSYSIYIVHAVIFYAVGIMLQAGGKILHLPIISEGFGGSRVFSTGHVLIDLAIIVALLAISVAVSSVTYRLIEKPFMVSEKPEARRGIRTGQSEPAAVLA